MKTEAANPAAKRAFAAEAAVRLRAAGHLAYWAGGCVRDLILGLEPDDYDVATSAEPRQVMALFPRTVPVGISFGVVRVIGPRRAGEVEVATFRSDGEYRDGRRPESVEFGAPETDAQRRDFTINGMFFDPIDERVIDFVGGQEDLRARRLRAIGDPRARFEEDKLRLIRAVRFAARFEMEIDPATRDAVAAMADQIIVVAPERIAQELRKMLVHPRRSVAMRLCRELGLLRAILPALNDSPVIDWPNLWSVLDALPDRPSVPLAFAALLHPLPASTIDRIGEDLRLSNDERRGAERLAARQRDLADFSNLSVVDRKRRLSAKDVDDLIALHQALEIASLGASPNSDQARRYLRDQPEGPINPSPLLTGDDLKRVGYLPGPAFARMLEQARDAQLAGSVHTAAEAVQWLREHEIGGVSKSGDGYR